MSEKKEIQEFDYVFDIDDGPQVHTLTCLNNKKRPEEKQMKVTLEPLSAKEADSIVRDAFKFAGKRPKDEEGKEFEKWNTKYMEYFLEKNFSKKVTKLENIFFKIGDKVKEITKVSELYGMKSKTASAIVTEIKEFIDIQEDVPEKN
jgi:hypothetical protein